jgi:hypothetical protein
VAVRWRLPIRVLGNGDFPTANTAVWTAAHYQIPCLIVVRNNRSFSNDELHQERVAKERNRPPGPRKNWVHNPKLASLCFRRAGNRPLSLRLAEEPPGRG